MDAPGSIPYIKLASLLGNFSADRGHQPMPSAPSVYGCAPWQGLQKDTDVYTRFVYLDLNSAINLLMLTLIKYIDMWLYVVIIILHVSLDLLQSPNRSSFLMEKWVNCSLCFSWWFQWNKCDVFSPLVCWLNKIPRVYLLIRELTD